MTSFARVTPQTGPDGVYMSNPPLQPKRQSFSPAPQPTQQPAPQRPSTPSGGVDMSAYRPGQAQPMQQSYGSPYQPAAPSPAPQPTLGGDRWFAGGTPYFDERGGRPRQPAFQMAPAQTPWGQSMDPFAERDAFVNQINQQRMQNQIAFNSSGSTNPAAGIRPGIDYQKAMQDAGLGGGAPSMSPNYGDSLIGRLNQQFGGSAYTPPPTGEFGGLEAGMMQQLNPRPNPYAQQQDFGAPQGWSGVPGGMLPQPTPLAEPAMPPMHNGLPVVYQNGVAGTVDLGSAGRFPGMIGTLGGPGFRPLPQQPPSPPQMGGIRHWSDNPAYQQPQVPAGWEGRKGSDTYASNLPLGSEDWWRQQNARAQTAQAAERPVATPSHQPIASTRRTGYQNATPPGPLPVDWRDPSPPPPAERPWWEHPAAGRTKAQTTPGSSFQWGAVSPGSASGASAPAQSAPRPAPQTRADRLSSAITSARQAVQRGAAPPPRPWQARMG